MPDNRNNYYSNATDLSFAFFKHQLLPPKIKRAFAVIRGKKTQPVVTFKTYEDTGLPVLYMPEVVTRTELWHVFRQYLLIHISTHTLIAHNVRVADASTGWANGERQWVTRPPWTDMVRDKQLLFDPEWVPAGGVTFKDPHHMDAPSLQTWMQHIIDNETPAGAPGPQRRFALRYSYTGGHPSWKRVPAKYQQPKGATPRSRREGTMVVPDIIGDVSLKDISLPPTPSQVAEAYEVIENDLTEFRESHEDGGDIYAGWNGTTRLSNVNASAPSKSKSARVNKEKTSSEKSVQGSSRAKPQAGRQKSKRARHVKGRAKAKGKGKGRATSDDEGSMEDDETSEEEDFDERINEVSEDDEDLEEDELDYDGGSIGVRDADPRADNDDLLLSAYLIDRPAPSTQFDSPEDILDYLRSLHNSDPWQRVLDRLQHRVSVFHI